MKAVAAEDPALGKALPSQKLPPSSSKLSSKPPAASQEHLLRGCCVKSVQMSRNGLPEAKSIRPASCSKDFPLTSPALLIPLPGPVVPGQTRWRPLRRHRAEPSLTGGSRSTNWLSSSCGASSLLLLILSSSSSAWKARYNHPVAKKAPPR